MKITIAKDIISEFMIGVTDVGDGEDGWELVERTVTGEWRHGNEYRIVVHHAAHGYYAYDWRDQQNGEWSSFNDEPDPVELYRVAPVTATAIRYERGGLVTEEQLTERVDVKATAATLHQIAGWGSSRPQTDDEWDALAQEVEQIQPGWACPMCQEVDCDDDCPLAAARKAHPEPDDEEVPS